MSRSMPLAGQPMQKLKANEKKEERIHYQSFDDVCCGFFTYCVSIIFLLPCYLPSWYVLTFPSFGYDRNHRHFEAPRRTYIWHNSHILCYIFFLSSLISVQSLPKSVIKTRLNCFAFASSASLPTYALTSPIIRVFPRRSKSDACRSWLSFKAETRA